jgi:hypothetical protein
MTQQTTFPSAHALVEYINPDRLHKNPAYVSGLANPDFLIEMDAVAVVPLA